MVKTNTLTLEDNYPDLYELHNYNNLKMIGAIFTESRSRFYEICHDCGIDEEDEEDEIYDIIFDINTRFLKTIKYTDNTNIALADNVYPGTVEINLTDYETLYDEEDYFDTVRELLSK